MDREVFATNDLARQRWADGRKEGSFERDDRRATTKFCFFCVFAFAFSFNSNSNGPMENSTDDEKRRARAMRAGEEMEEEGRA